MVGCLGSTYVSWSAAKPDRAPITIETNGLANEGETRFAMGRRPARRMAGAASTPQAQRNRRR